MNIVLLLSLFFPWIHFEYRSAEPASFFAFSFYTGYIGYGILVSVISIPFFLLSHTKKERIRASVPFRLSDTQAIVFIASLLITAMLHTIFMSEVFKQFADEIELGKGFLIATSSTICIIIAVFFLSKNTKEQSRDIRYLDHSDIDTLSEYRSIIDGSSIKGEKKEDSNMSLPI